jgi:hypothetical protein
MVYTPGAEQIKTLAARFFCLDGQMTAVSRDVASEAVARRAPRETLHSPCLSSESETVHSKSQLHWPVVRSVGC